MLTEVKSSAVTSRRRREKRRRGIDVALQAHVLGKAGLPPKAAKVTPLNLGYVHPDAPIRITGTCSRRQISPESWMGRPRRHCF